MMPRVFLQFVIVVFPAHSHLLFLTTRMKFESNYMLFYLLLQLNSYR